jgi:hypothetical protein
LLQAVVLAAGWQLWQPLLTFAVAAWKSTPPMKQPGPQLPPLHTSPVPQLAPSERADHADALVPGWQLSHRLSGSSVPEL